MGDYVSKLAIGLGISSSVGASSGSSSVGGENLVRSSNYAKQKAKDYVSFDAPFNEAVATTEVQYTTVLDAPMNYDIYLDSSCLHWYLVVHSNMEGANFPYITFEITTDKTLKLIPTMRIIHNENEQNYHAIAIFRDAARAVERGGSVAELMLKFSGFNMEKQGTVNTTMRKLSELAERIRQEMGTYRLLSNNCQHFCNTFLKALDLPTTATTTNLLSSDTSIDQLEDLFEVINET